MKKLLFVFFVLFTLSFVLPSSVESVNAQSYPYQIYGSTSIQMPSGGNVQQAYYLNSYPANAKLVWYVQGVNAYCYPAGDPSYCTVSFNEKGMYRLVCEFYVNGVRVDSSTAYITVY